jgi:hypothetical protein
MALGLTQSLTEMSSRNNSWGKGGRYVGMKTLPHSCADCLEIWEPQYFNNVIGWNSAGVVGFRCFGKQTIVPCFCRGVTLSFINI